MNKQLYVIITFPLILLVGIIWGIWFGITIVIEQAGKIWRLGGNWNTDTY
jgi:uncharacterized protein YneF (UPF0154 family)